MQITDAQLYWALSGLSRLQSLEIGRLPSLVTLSWLGQESLASSLTELKLGEASRAGGTAYSGAEQESRRIRCAAGTWKAQLAS